ncbi:hypothetical protein GEV39_22115 [Pseudomonas sp. NY5710]|uniref:hypothetical protein n=1 Tax=Pseudomonas sp. NY5710 TaxID=2662033 RepID=UPI00156E9633|nr:hypothetical protein [Pseudomonas sp. NY5710]QKL03892.1 hypothetical protein GEV39_22115 [Pseudomonas sp. NY5710]
MMDTPQKPIKLARNSQGDLGPKDWIKEGDGLYVSARHLWASWVVKSRKFENLRDFKNMRREFINHVNVSNGFPKASILLIGYCVEMYLKAGLTKLFIGYPDDSFRSQLRSYSHNFRAIASDLLTNISHQQISDLDSLKNFVLNDARYPVEGGENEEYVNSYNKRYRKIFNANSFKRYCMLAKHIKHEVGKIDSDSSNPCSHKSWEVGQDGFLCYRYGGNLPPRITYRNCSSEPLQDDVVGEVKDLMEQNDIHIPGRFADYMLFVEVVKQNGIRQLKKKR